jgi:hypothetical protein
VSPKSLSLVAISILAALTGFLDVKVQVVGGLTQQALFIVPPVVGLGLLFIWLHCDSDEFGFSRSTFLNIGIVVMPIVFIPCYLFKSRPTGRRGKSIRLFFMFVLACVLAYLLGAWIADINNPGQSNLNNRNNREQSGTIGDTNKS